MKTSTQRARRRGLTSDALAVVLACAVGAALIFPLAFTLAASFN